MSDSKYLQLNKKGCIAIPFDEWDSLISSNVTEDILPDDNGYPLQPTGASIFTLSSVVNILLQESIITMTCPTKDAPNYFRTMPSWWGGLIIPGFAFMQKYQRKKQ